MQDNIESRINQAWRRFEQELAAYRATVEQLVELASLTIDTAYGAQRVDEPAQSTLTPTAISQANPAVATVASTAPACRAFLQGRAPRHR